MRHTRLARRVIHPCANAIRLWRIQHFTSHRASKRLRSPMNSSSPRVQASVPSQLTLATCPVDHARADWSQLCCNQKKKKKRKEEGWRLLGGFKLKPKAPCSWSFGCGRSHKPKKKMKKNILSFRGCLELQLELRFSSLT